MGPGFSLREPRDDAESWIFAISPLFFYATAGFGCSSGFTSGGSGLT
jgi:hypothetical protein